MEQPKDTIKFIINSFNKIKDCINNILDPKLEQYLIILNKNDLDKGEQRWKSLMMFLT